MRRKLNRSQRRVRRVTRAPGITPADPSPIFDLGKSVGCDVAKNKRAMIAEAFAARNRGQGGST
jgi:hypothetical protein